MEEHCIPEVVLNLTVEGSQFTNNATSYGRAMYSTSSNIMIKACGFANNMAIVVEEGFIHLLAM